MWGTIILSIVIIVYNTSAGICSHEGKIIQSDEIGGINANEQGVAEEEENNQPWAEKNHFLFDISFLGTTLKGVGFSAGIGLTRGLMGIHVDYDYHEEINITVYPGKYQKIYSLLSGPAFRLKWFRVHVLTGISYLEYRTRGDIDSIHFSSCESFPCFNTYYHEELQGGVASWPFAIKWYYARKFFGIGMKLQTNVNAVLSSFSAGVVCYGIIPGSLK